MDSQQVERLIAVYTAKYGETITYRQACEIAHRKIQTLYDLSHQGFFDDFIIRGRPVLLTVDGFVRFLASRNRNNRQ